MKKSNLLKKALVSGLALTMIVGGSASAFAQGDHGKGNGSVKFELKGKAKGKHEFKLEFKDVGKGYEWASKHIASLASERVFEGYTDGSFKPNKPVTRIEAVATAIRLMGLKEEAESEESMETTLSFKDAKHIEKKHAWATGYLALAVENELVTDVNGEFQPKKPADRLWVAELLVKALGLESEAAAKINVQLDFKDSEEIPADSIGYVAVAVEKKIVQGYTNNTFRPNKPVTRAELAAFLDRTGDHLPEFNDGATRGTVTADVYDNKLFIAQGSQTVELTLDPDAFIYRDGEKITSTELEIGDEVKIRSYNDVVIFIEVTKNAEEETTVNLTGILTTAISADTITIKKEDQTTVQFNLSDDANIFRDGKEVEASELKIGDELLVRVEGNEVVFVQVTKNAVVNANYTGTLDTAVTSNELSITKEDETQIEFELAEDAVIYRGGVEVEASALKAGDEVFVNVQNSEIVLVQVTKTVEETTFTVNGLFKSMTLNAQGEISTITITQTTSDEGTQDSIYNVSEDVAITGDFTLLVLNNEVELQGEAQLVTSIEIK